MKTPQHIGIIMDGNGRWAQARGHRRSYGHVRGAKVAREVTQWSAQLGIKYLTLYTFSTENWQRPPEEINLLMVLLRKFLQRERTTLIRENIKFNCIGKWQSLPKFAVDEIEKSFAATRKNTGMVLTLALNYGGREEIVDRAKVLAEMVKSGAIAANEITEKSFAQGLYTHDLPDPDLIIRTSGESRLSNFMGWQNAYSELYFTPKLWPAFSMDDLKEAISSFGGRQRRFGGQTTVATRPQLTL